ncbi:MAG TPA: S-adenosylmethionine:tRNA ribosyltransferase-isomerase [Tepidiformaceae bacterium]|nr:S-adenosylmethionine:tRNA ribosyltransferase-isomerase [Tepidiformaceae bacterium]
MPSPFDFDLPGNLEATEPPEARGISRDEVRLLVSYRGSDRFVHANFRDLAWFLDPGDLVVVNDSATLPAALSAREAAGHEFVLNLSTRLTGTTWVVEPRNAVVEVGAIVELPGGGRARLLRPHRGSQRLWQAELEIPDSFLAYLRAWGRPISYKYVRREWPIEAYQTVYAREPGSAEMPSAGRAFSPRVFDALARRGVRVEAITLHTGVASLEAHEPPYEEWFKVPEQTALAVELARSRGSRVVAVGTTVLRAMESSLDPSGRVEPRSGWTDLVITPGRTMRSATALLTGFHEPRASHLQLLSAVADTGHIQVAYREALTHGYLWHEFGDMHLIL